MPQRKTFLMIISLALILSLLLLFIPERRGHYEVQMKDGTIIKAYRASPYQGSLSIQIDAWSNPFYIPPDQYIKTEYVED